MTNNSKAVVDETEKLKNEIASLKQQLHEANETIKLIQTGNIDALIASDKKNLKVYTEKTADKIYRILIEEMHEGAVTINKDGLILYCNTYFAKIVELPLQNVLGKKFKSFLHESSIKLFEDVFEQGWKDYSQVEIHICAKKGKCVPVLMSVNNLKLDDNAVLSIIITDLTITNRNQEELKLRTEELEQKNMELGSANLLLAYQNREKEKRAKELINTYKILASAEEQFRLVVESTPNAMVLVDSDGIITLVNNQTEKLFGYNRDELLGNKLEILIPERYRNLNVQQKNAFFKNPKGRKIGHGRELFGLNKNGTEIAVEIGLNPIETPNGNMVLVSIVDITERKNNAAKLINLNMELVIQNQEKEKRAAELAIANRELKQAELFQKEYIKGLEGMMFMTSHKLRVPITNILGLSEILTLVINSPEKLKKMVDHIKESALILDSFTKELSVYMEDLEHKGRK